MAFRVIGPWRNGEEWLTAFKPQPPKAAMLLPLDSWEDKSISMASTTLPWKLCRMSSSVLLLWCGKSLLSNSIGGCLRDKALISLDSLGYRNSCGLSWKFSKRYLLLALNPSCSGVFLVSGELTWRALLCPSTPGSCGSLLTWRSGDSAVLLGLGFSSSSSESELLLFRDSTKESNEIYC